MDAKFSYKYAIDNPTYWIKLIDQIKKLFKDYDLEIEGSDIYLIIYIAGQTTEYRNLFNVKTFDPEKHTLEFCRKVNEIVKVLKSEKKNSLNDFELFPCIKPCENYVPIQVICNDNNDTPFSLINDHENLVIMIIPYSSDLKMGDYLQSIKNHLKKKGIKARVVNLAITTKAIINTLETPTEIDYYLDKDSEYTDYVKKMYDLQLQTHGRHCIIVNKGGEVVWSRGRIGSGSSDSDLEAISVCLQVNQHSCEGRDFPLRQKVDNYKIMPDILNEEGVTLDNCFCAMFCIDEEETGLKVKHLFR